MGILVSVHLRLHSILRRPGCSCGPGMTSVPVSASRRHSPPSPTATLPRPARRVRRAGPTCLTKPRGSR